MPTILRTNVATVWIHKGAEPFGSGDKNLPDHVGQAEWYVADGISNLIVSSHLALPTHSRWPSQHATDYTPLSAGWRTKNPRYPLETGGSRQYARED